MHFVKFTEYIPLMKSQPYDNSLLFSSCYHESPCTVTNIDDTVNLDSL